MDVRWWAVEPRVRLEERNKGCALVHENGDTWTMSWMDAAKLLWHLRHALRAHRIGRRCIDSAYDIAQGKTGRWIGWRYEDDLPRRFGP